MKNKIAFIFVLTISFMSCQNNQTKTIKETSGEGIALEINQSKDPFSDYWYQGKAELTSFELKQARYGEIHKGESVMIFVTEDFSTSKQVKMDYPSRNPKDKAGVMKLNFTRKFNTGIYPYSIMQSTFTPVDTKRYPNSLKVSCTSQEWCGHTFMQLNLKPEGFQVQQNSYFESEGDQNFLLDKAILEDEIWNRIRLNPKDLPEGKINIIPGTVFTRLKHTPFKVEEAVALKAVNDGIITYSIDYRSLQRKLSIQFKKSFPHEILSWEETISGGYGPNAKLLTTTAKRKKTILLDYWKKNSNRDAGLRDELDLE